MTDFKIDRLGQHGDGIVNNGNDDIFVPFALPGELVTGEISNGRVEGAKIVQPSTDRIAASCRHFKSCGGCVIQHTSDEYLANWKTLIVEKALKDRGLETTLKPIYQSPKHSRRRVAFSGTRTKKGAMVGFHRRLSNEIIEITDCPVIVPELQAAIPFLQEITRMAASRKSAVRLHVTQAQNGLDIVVDDAIDLTPQDLANLGAKVKPHGVARITWNGQVIVQHDPPVQNFGAAKVTPPPGAFLQPTKDGEDALVQCVVDALSSAKNVVDLFSGSGTFTFPIAEFAAVHAVETDKDMISALDHGMRFAKGLKAVTSEARDLFRRPLLPDELAKIDAVVLDPPRAGAIAQCHEIVSSKVKRVVYVSCSPSSFARDAQVLCNGGFTLNWVKPVDQFRWTNHVELVGYLTRD